MAQAIRLNNPNSPKFTSTGVLQRQVLNKASLSDNENKFYIIEVQSGTGDYPYRIYTEFGRMGGKTPAQEGRYFRGRWEAENEYDDIVRSKEAKGYKKVTVDDGSQYTTTVAKVTTKKNTDLAQIKDKVLKLIGKLYNSATDYLVKSIDTPLGKLSANQVAKGLQILTEIEQELDRGVTGRNFEYLSNEFYSIIPVTFGVSLREEKNYKKFIIDNYEKLNDRKDLLGVMSSVITAQDTLEKSIDDKYKSLKIKLKSISSTTADYKRIVKWIKDTKGYNHHTGMDVKEIFAVEDMNGYDKFNPYKVSTMELFHGTRNENMLSIMQNGLKIKPASAVHTGSMFGAGIYFADCSTKSGNYTNGFGSASNNGIDTNFLFICEVATGKIKEYTDSQTNLSKAPMGYNSVMGKKGRNLVHNEYIVYNDSQVKIKYIVEYKRV